MAKSELTDFEVEDQGFKLKIRRGAGSKPIAAGAGGSLHPFVAAESTAPFPVAAAAPAPLTPLVAVPPAEDAGVTYIKSPMVGTFYRAASPESKSFADVGTKVVENTVVCIIEAMKIMNEIQAETKGVVVEALVENGQPVEYGQRLFKLKQA